MSNIRILPLGGQDERNKNCYVIKNDDDIFIFDCGVKAPVNIQFGISTIAPDFSVLKKDASKIKGIFLGYPSYSNYGGLTHLLQKIGNKVPIYCTKIGKIIIETYLEKKCWNYNKTHELNFIVIDNLKSIPFNKTEIIPYGICNSIPGSVGWIIKTIDGSIVFTDDFIINNDRSKMFQTQFSRLENLTRNNVLALIPSLGIVDKNKSFTTPDHKNATFYQTIISKNPDTRIFIGCTDADANTIINIAKIAKNEGRPFSIYSNTFMNVFSNIVKQKLINIKGLRCLQVSEINSSDNAIVVISSNQEHLFKNLIAITNGSNSAISFKSTDIFVLGTELIPGYEGYAADLLDRLSKLDIQSFVIPKTVLPMRASAEDHKFMLDKLLPKYVFPIQGLYKSVTKYCNYASQTWTKPEQIVFLDNGEEAQIIDGVLQKKKNHYKLSECYINTSGLDDSASHIIYEREKLSESGVLIVSLFFNKAKQKFIDKINYQTYGIMSDSQVNKQKLEKIIDDFKKILPEQLILTKRKNIDHKSTKKNMKKQLMKLFEKAFDKRPIVLVTIIEC